MSLLQSDRGAHFPSVDLNLSNVTFDQLVVIERLCDRPLFVTKKSLYGANIIIKLLFYEAIIHTPRSEGNQHLSVSSGSDSAAEPRIDFYFEKKSQTQCSFCLSGVNIFSVVNDVLKKMYRYVFE